MSIFVCAKVLLIHLYLQEAKCKVLNLSDDSNLSKLMIVRIILNLEYRKASFKKKIIFIKTCNYLSLF